MALILSPTRSIIRPKPLLGTQIDRSHPLSRGLVGCWLMNEGAGTQVRDASGQNPVGSLVGGAVWSAGERGPCVSGGLDTTDSVSISSVPVQSGMPALTILARARNNKSKVASTGREYLACKRNAYTCGWTQDERIEAMVRVAGKTKSSTTASGYHTQGTLWRQFGTWHDGQVVCPIFEGQILSSVAAAAVGSVNVQTNDLYLGGDGDTSSWDGQLEYVYIWSRALSPSEIASLYADPYQMFRCENTVILGGASGANNYSFTINDGMGVSDDKSLLAAVVRALSEAVGMADTASRAATMLRALTESLGIADSVIESTAAQLVETINDGVGLTDAQSRLSIMVRAMAEALGIADSATTLAVLLRTITDAQGITDGRTLARIVALADDLGVSDEMGRIVAYLRGRSDSVGLSDTMTRLHAAVREITDTEGLTDSYSTAWTVLRTIADTLGLTDAMIQEGTGALVRVINDVLGIVDSRTKLHAALRVLASTMGTADSMSRLFAVTRVISDAEGITDGAYQGKVFTIAESIGISDEVTRLVAFLRTQDDSVGVLEAILKVSNVIRSLDDAIEMTDVEQHSLSGLVQAALAFLFLKKGR